MLPRFTVAAKRLLQWMRAFGGSGPAFPPSRQTVGEESRATCLGMLLCLAVFASGANARQVVTEEDHAWAKRALAEEKALGTAPAPNTVGVLYFRNRTGRAELDPLQKGLALMLVTDLAAVEGLQVVERPRLQALAEELGLGLSGLVEEGSAPRVGRLLGSRWLVGGDLLAPAPSRTRVDASVLDVPKGIAAARPSAEGELSRFFEVEKALLFAILSAVQVELTPAQRDRLRRPCTRSTTALLALSRAVDASDAGRYQEAADLYEKALEEDPEVCVAGEGLKELKSLRLIGPRVQGRTLLRELRDGTSLTNELTPKDQFRGTRTPAESRTPTNVEITFP